MQPAFAADPATAAYYDQQAREYDDWYLVRGRFATRSRPGWEDEVARIIELVRGLPPARTLEGWEERVLSDGSRHQVFKRFLTPEELTEELGAETLFAGRWFVAGRVRF